MCLSCSKSDLQRRNYKHLIVETSYALALLEEEKGKEEKGQGGESESESIIILNQARNTENDNTQDEAT